MAQKRQQSKNVRAEIAATAARMIANGTAGGFEGAKRKAARELGAENSQNLPDNLEVHNALAEYLTLFHADTHGTRMLLLREAALKAMEFLEIFEPRLTGSVLYGTACDHSAIHLHLSTPELEAVTRYLIERRLAYDFTEARFRFRRSTAMQSVPLFKLIIVEQRFELAVFPTEGAMRHPLSPIDGKPMQRAAIPAVARLISSGQVFNSLWFSVIHAARPFCTPMRR